MMETVLLMAISAAVGAAIAGVAIRASSRRSLRSVERQLDRATAELHATERSSQERRDVQDLILDAMEEGVLLLGPDGDRIFSNASIGRHLGTVPDSVDAILPVDLQRAARRVGSAHDVERLEVEIGSPARWLLATVLPIGETGAVLLVVRDVTQAKQLIAMRRDFVANASHELKTPVASIRAAAETLRDGAINDPPAAQRFTEQLEREAIRLSRIIADLLDLSRLESGGEMDEQVRVDLVATDEVERLQDMARARGIALQANVRRVPLVEGSGRDLALLVRNLIDNAIRYTSTGGSVDVTVSASDDHVILRVEDTGIGIPQRELPRIFERFYRVDRARSRDTGGTGLGLAIVKHVTENHGGDVRVDSELGRGTTFEVRLPVDHERSSDP